MYELIAAAVVAISSLISKKVKTDKVSRVEEEATRQALVDEGNSIFNAGWNEIDKGFGSANILTTGGIIELNKRKAYEKSKAVAEKEFQQTLLIIGIAAAGLLILILILKRKS